MNKAILMSIKPKWCELIVSGKKTIEVRKTRPKIDTPFKVYIYCTNSPPYLVYEARSNGYRFVAGCSREQADEIWGVFNGKVIGEFVCDEIAKYLCGGSLMYYFDIDASCWAPVDQMCLTQGDLFKYGDGETLYGWHISNLTIYDEPKGLQEFIRPCDRESKLCFSCKRFAVGADNEFVCDNAIKRPFQSWGYVE